MQLWQSQICGLATELLLKFDRWRLDRGLLPQTQVLEHGLDVHKDLPDLMKCIASVKLGLSKEEACIPGWVTGDHCASAPRGPDQICNLEVNCRLVYYSVLARLG